LNETSVTDETPATTSARHRFFAACPLNVADMLSAFMRRNGAVSVCGTCMDARGIRDEELVQGAARGTMDQLTEWSMWADKILVF